MDATTLSLRVPTTDPKVRSACDRCRSQKLKCDQSSTPNGSGRCSRCARANTECTTGAPRPSGRPSRQHLRKQALQTRRTVVSGRSENGSLAHEPQSNASLLAEHLTPNGRDATVLPEIIEDATAYSNFSEDSGFDTTFLNENFFLEDEMSMANKTTSNVSSDQPHHNLHTTSDPSFLDLDFPLTTSLVPQPQNPCLHVGDRAHYLKRLAEMNSTLLQHLSEIDQLVYGDCCTSVLSSTRSPVNQKPSIHSHALGSNLDITKMQSFLQELSAILSYFLISAEITAAPRLSPNVNATSFETDSDCSESEISEESDEDSASVEYHFERSRSMETRSTRQKSHQTSPPNSNPVIEYPTILALITCYVSLIRLFRETFKRILTALERCSTRQEVPLYSDLAPLLPELCMNKFSLKMHRSLQIFVFMHIVLEVMWRVERAITALAAAERHIPATPSSGNMDLLRLMLKQEAATAETHSTGQPSQRKGQTEAIGRQSLKGLAKQIRSLCRGHICLQLEEATATVGLADFATDPEMEFVRAGGPRLANCFQF